ncbi:MAG TPA: DUF507 family protein [Candidatus Binatia bacterium]|nr:DUF507 family protein [Candidatus Binatia bacterium]
MRAGEIQRIAVTAARGLLAGGQVRSVAEESRIAERISEIIAHSFEEEAKLEAEAERLAAAHANKMAGMDHRRIVRGIMERLARERDFPL